MKILFYAINGIGVGHLSRLIGIAEEIMRLDLNTQSFFISEISDTRLLKLHNLPFFHLPPLHAIKEDSQWKGIRKNSLKAWEKAICGSITGFSPDLIVYDTLVPTKVTKAVKSVKKKPKEIFILRKRNNLMQFFLDKQENFTRVKLIIFPHYKNEVKLKNIPKQFREKIYFSGPIIRRGVKKIKLKPIKEKYNISENELKLRGLRGHGFFYLYYPDLKSRIFPGKTFELKSSISLSIQPWPNSPRFSGSGINLQKIGVGGKI